MAIYVSTTCLLNNKNSVFDVLDACAQAGLKNIELGITPASATELPLSRFKTYGFNYLCHNLFPPPPEPLIVNLASQDPAIMRRSKVQIKASIDFCQSLDIRLFTFHAGFRADPDSKFKFPRDRVAPYETAFNTFVEAVKEINDYALNKKVRIAIENNVLAGYNLVNGENHYLLMCRADEFAELFRRIPSANVGVLLDLGHLKVTAGCLGFDRYDFVNRVQDRVFAIHAHENDGQVDEHKALDMTSWCLEIIGRKHFYGLPVVLESFGVTVSQLAQQVRLLERLGE